MADLTLLGMCGSLRAASLNRKLMMQAAECFGGTFVDGDLRLPLYDGDLEERDVPDAVKGLAGQVKAADAVVLASPEYNQSLSGVMKNALDWISRVPGAVWRDKPVAIVSATAGRAGGARAQYALRLAMNPFRPRLLTGPEVMVAGAAREFDDTGRLVSESYRNVLAELMERLRAEAERG